MSWRDCFFRGSAGKSALRADFPSRFKKRKAGGNPLVQLGLKQGGGSFHECKSYSELGGNRCNRVRCCDSFDWWSSIVWQFGIACRFRQRGPLCALVQFSRTRPPGYDRTRVCDDLTRRLREYLSSLNLESVVVELTGERPVRDPSGGKLRQFCADQ